MKTEGSTKWDAERAKLFLEGMAADLRRRAALYERGSKLDAIRGDEDGFRSLLAEMFEGDIDEEEMAGILLLAQERRCRECFCTDEDCLDCVEAAPDGRPCHWVEDDLCSRCEVPPAVPRRVIPERGDGQ